MAKGVNIEYIVTYQPIYDNAGDVKSYLYTIDNNALLPKVFFDYSMEELLGETRRGVRVTPGEYVIPFGKDELDKTLTEIRNDILNTLAKEGYKDGATVLPKRGTFIPDEGLSENYNESEDDLVLPIKIKGRLIDSVTGENTVIDVTAQFPLRQAMWIAEAMKRLDPDVQKFLPVSGPLTALGAIDEGEGTFEDWFDLKEATETFLGVGIRSGAGNVFVDEIASILGGGGADPTVTERSKKALGRLVGDYIRTHLIPVTQVVEIQRMVGTRPAEYADYSSDDPYTFTGQLRRSLDQSGVTSLFDPSKESELPSREFVLAEDRKRVGTGLGLMAGITVLQENDPDAEYLIEKGFTEFELSSKDKGSIRREENILMRERIPEIVELAKEQEAYARQNYDSQPDGYKKNTTLQEHINAEVIASVTEQVKNIRRGLSKAKLVNTDEATIEYRKYKRHSPAVRRAALQRFLQENDGEQPDTTNFDHLFDLNFHAEMIKKEGGG